MDYRCKSCEKTEGTLNKPVPALFSNTPCNPPYSPQGYRISGEGFWYGGYDFQRGGPANDLSAAVAATLPSSSVSQTSSYSSESPFKSIASLQPMAFCCCFALSLSHCDVGMSSPDISDINLGATLPTKEPHASSFAHPYLTDSSGSSLCSASSARSASAKKGKLAESPFLAPKYV
jgi:hypothetical protein